jgi:hypothetical protein
MMNIDELTVVPTFGITNIESLTPEIKTNLLELGKKYMMFVAWEKRHCYYDELDEEMKFLTFQEIIHQEYNGSVDEAMEFLTKELYNANRNDYLGWLREKQPLEEGEPIPATVLQFLCVMKTFVMQFSLDELKEFLGLEFSLK